LNYTSHSEFILKTGMAKGKDSGKVVPTSSSTGGTKGKGRNGR
jgi:hypothetical protein